MGQQRRQARRVKPPEPDPAPAAEATTAEAGGDDPDDPKVMVGQWTGALACALWIASRDNIHDFAGWLGVGSSTVEAWKDNPDIVPTPTSQRVLDEALLRLDDTAKRKFALLVAGNAAVWVSDSLWPNGNGAHANRRQVNKAAAAGLAVALAPPEVVERIAAAVRRAGPVDAAVVADHEELADTLALAHRTMRPDVLVDQVARQAETLLVLLDRPVGPALRRRLEAVTVGSHAQAGLLSLYLCDRPAMRRFFALARQVAGDSADPTLQAQAVAVSSLVYSAIQTDGRGGDVERALRLKRQAVHYARASDPKTLAWAQRWLAEELAVAHDERGFRQAVQAADRLAAQAGHQDGRGFFPRYLARTPEQEDRSSGVGLVWLGRAAEAIEVLQAAIVDGGPGWIVMTLTDIAAARALQGEPEQACQELTRALKLARAHGDLMGLARIWSVRGRFRPEWDDLACVRSLDELLRQPRDPFLSV